MVSLQLLKLLTSDWVCIGYVIRSHGVRGALRCRLDADAALILPVGSKLQLSKQDILLPVEVLAAKTAHTDTLVSFCEINNREEAMRFHGASLLMQSQHLPPVSDNETYAYELIGANVCDIAGVVLGCVTSIFNNNGQDLLIVQTPQGERLCPLVDAFFCSFDREHKKLILDLPAGLWDQT